VLDGAILENISSLVVLHCGGLNRPLDKASAPNDILEPKIVAAGEKSGAQLLAAEPSTQHIGR